MGFGSFVANVLDRPSVCQLWTKPEDFFIGAWEPIEPDILLKDPNLSLFCVDPADMSLWFTETPSSVDVHDAAFMFEVQRTHATRVVKISRDTAQQVAAEAKVDPSKITLINSIGRCGSTLVSKALASYEGMASLSEPDVFTQLVEIWGRDNFNGGAREALLRDCTILQCLPTRLRGRTHWALKFRSYVSTMGPMHARAVPEAKQVFIYRTLLPWFKSYVRMLGGGDIHAKWPNESYVRFLGSIIPHLEGKTEAPLAEVVAGVWVGVIEAALDMKEAGVPLFLLRYEELVKCPGLAIDALAEACGLGPFDASQLDLTLSKDSQEGTFLSRASVREIKVDLSDSDIRMIQGIARNMSSRIPSSGFLPGTFDR